MYCTGYVKLKNRNYEQKGIDTKGIKSQRTKYC